jgi:hypothetical protein
VDIEPLAIHRVEGKEMILASGRPIATLVRPGDVSGTAVDSFGFEIVIPTPVTELEARAIAYLIYRTMRKSGIRWAMWRPDAPRVAEPSTARASVDAAADATESVGGETGDSERLTSAPRSLLAVSAPRTWPDLTTALAVLSLAAAGILAVGVAPVVTIPLAAVLLGAVVLLRSTRLT